MAEAQAAAELAPLLRDEARRVGCRAPCFESIEMPLVPVLVRMEELGVGARPRGARCALGRDARASIEALAAEIHELAGVEFTIDSPKQLGEVLFDKLGLPSQKKTKTGYSTDASVLAALAPLAPDRREDRGVPRAHEAHSTYIDALPRLLGEDGRLHTTFNQTVAATGRLSSSQPEPAEHPGPDRARAAHPRRVRARPRRAT